MGQFQIRDIDQLRNSPSFSTTAVEGFLTIERELAEFLRHVPYCSQHLGVWSHHLAGIILEAASQIDSVWKASTHIDDPASATSNLTIKDHRKRYGAEVAKQKLVLFASDASCVIAPYGQWINQNSPASTKWWDAYNSLKHDRFSNHTEGNLDHAVQAVAGLLLAIIYCGHCDLAIMNANLLDSSQYNPWAVTTNGRLNGVTSEGRSKVESELLAHPLGFGDPVAKSVYPSMWHSKSFRFNAWWVLHGQTFS